MKHWILGLDELGSDADLANWLDAQPDPEDAVKAALRAFAFGSPQAAERAPLDHPLLRQALATLRAAVADVEAAAGLPASEVAARGLVAAAIEVAAAEADSEVPPEVVDDKIGKLLDFDEDREADLTLPAEGGEA